ncbi:hypothetical protein HDU86_000061 [Geranomyces michiganensis]|nr:hypothetical protein HDU86_000061 [Geranomyces michiganensis]
MKPDHFAGGWAANTTTPPVYFRRVHLIRYLWRPVDSVLPIRDALDTHNTTSPSSPHMVLRLPMHFVEEKIIFDGVEMQKLATKRQQALHVCLKQSKTEGERQDCAWNDVTIVNYFAPASEQPYDRLISADPLNNGTDRRLFYLPTFVMPPERLTPADFLPLDQELGVPKGHASEPFSVELTSSLCTGETSSLWNSLERFPAPAKLRFDHFPPRFPNETYHADAVQFAAERENFLGGAHPPAPLLVANPWIRFTLLEAGNFLSLFATNLRFVYFLCRHSTVGISRAGVQTAAVWQSFVAIMRILKFLWKLKAQGGWLMKMATESLKGLLFISEDGSIVNGLAVSAAALFVTQKCYIEWTGLLPRLRSDSLTKNERKSDRDDAFPWAYRIAVCKAFVMHYRFVSVGIMTEIFSLLRQQLLAGSAIIHPLLTSEMPTSWSSLYHRYRYRADYVTVGALAATVLQFRLNQKRHTFAGAYKVAEWMALLNHATAIALLTVSAPAKLSWAPWAQICVDVVAVTQAWAYPSAPNVRETDEYAD